MYLIILIPLLLTGCTNEDVVWAQVFTAYLRETIPHWIWYIIACYFVLEIIYKVSMITYSYVKFKRRKLEHGC